MAEKNLKVLAECVDVRSGKRFVPGDAFDPPPTVAQAKRLIAAGCLPEGALGHAKDVEDDGGVDGAAIARDQLNNDGLFDKSDGELVELASAEGVDLKGETDKVAVISAIRAHRAAGNSRIDPENLEMRTEEGEREAREADAQARDTAARKPAKAAK